MQDAELQNPTTSSPPGLTGAPDAALSVLGQRWKLREPELKDVLFLSQQTGAPEMLARIMAARGIAAAQADIFLKPTLRALLPDPHHLKDMAPAALRVAKAIRARETIAVFGDYDVDGATSSALLIRYFRALGLDPLVHIPDRMKEGYGPNAPALLSLKARGASLCITVDCGTMAFAPLKAAQEAGLEMIVVDHHKGEAQLPEALAVVNPNRADETSPHGQLAAVGVAFMLLVAVNKALREAGLQPPDLMQWLDIVALGTICDVVPLTGPNRALVAQGLKIMQRRGNPGISAVMDVAKLDEAPGTYHAGFVIGPRINAGGRVGQADLGVKLLTTDDPLEARTIAAQLDQYNNERKAIEALVLQEAREQAAAQPPDAPMLLLAGKGWHAGVIGVVASRIKDAFHKPTAIIALEGGMGKASARSVGGVDIGAAVVAAVQAGILSHGGGHMMAAGFTVAEDKVEALREFLCKHMGAACAVLPRERSLWLDSSVSLAGAKVELVRLLEQLGPFGTGNPQLRLLLPRVRAVRADIVGDGHVRAILTDSSPHASSGGVKAMAFRSGGTPLGEALLTARGRLMDVACQLRINSWQGRESVDVFIDDVRWVE